MRTKLLIAQYVNRYIRKPLKAFFADAYIVSFPKSGRTQMRAFLSAYYSHKLGNPVDYMDDSLLARYYGAPRILFSHEIVPGNPACSAPVTINKKGRSRRKTVLLVRDPRDTLVSYYHHVTLRDSKRKVGSQVKHMDISAFIRSSRFGAPALMRFMERWGEHAAKDPQVVTISYEDMQHAPHEAFQKALHAIGETHVDEQALGRAVQGSSFDAMHTVEQTNTAGSDKLKTKLPTNPNAFKTRKGKVGSYKEELSGKDIAYIEKEMHKLPEILTYE